MGKGFYFYQEIKVLSNFHKASVYKSLARSHGHLWMREAEKYRWVHCHLKQNWEFNFTKSKCLSLFRYTIITVYHRLGGLETTVIYFTFWKLGSQRSRCWHIQYLVGLASWFRWPSFCCALTWRKGLEISRVSFIKALIPFRRALPS